MRTLRECSQEADDAFYSMPAFVFRLSLLYAMATGPDGVLTPLTAFNFLAHLICLRNDLNFADFILKYYFTVHWNDIKAHVEQTGASLQEVLDLKVRLEGIVSDHEERGLAFIFSYDVDDDDEGNNDSVAFELD